MDAEYLQPTRHGRMALAAVILVALIAALVAYCYATRTLAQGGDLPLCDQLARYRLVMRQLSLLLVLPGLGLAWFGSRMLRSGQSPPPGAWVLHRAQIKRGAPAMRAGGALLGLGLLIATLPVLLWTDVAQFQRASIARICP